MKKLFFTALFFSMLLLQSCYVHARITADSGGNKEHHDEGHHDERQHGGDDHH